MIRLLHASGVIRQCKRLRCLSTAAKELHVDTDGLRLAGVSYGNESSADKILLLHGWMDNSATHAVTAPALAAAGWHAVALDLPGHGRSGHRHSADSYNAGSHAVAVLEAAHALGWHETGFAICGHSMGAGVAACVAGALPHAITAYCALEGLGMNTKQDRDAPQAMAEAFISRMRLKGKRSKVYKNEAAAVAARVKTVSRYPGRQSLSLEAASLLIGRGTELSPCNALAGGIRFSHDQRLIEPSPLYLSDRGMRAFLSSIHAPALVVTGTRGWPWPHHMMLGRISSLLDAELHHMAGGHHLHIDPGPAEDVSTVLVDFLQRRKSSIDGRREAVRAGGRGHRHRAAAGKGGEEADDAADAARSLTKNTSDDIMHDGPPTSKQLLKALMPQYKRAEEVRGQRHNPSQHRSEAVDIGTPRWTQRHLYVARTMPASSHLPPHAASDPHRIHLPPSILHPVRVVTPHGWAKRVAELGPDMEHIQLATDPSAQVWQHMPEDLTGLSGSHSPAVRYGYYAPRVVCDTMPTLETAMALEMGVDPAALKAKGDSY